MRRAGVVAALLVTALWASTGPANAHASLEEADPAPGSTVSSSPRAVTLTFTEPPDPQLTTVEVLDVGGTPVPADDPVVDGTRTVRVELTEPLEDGTYTVSWRVVSTVDGHLTSGRVVFGVGVAPAAPADDEAPADEVARPSAGSIAAKSLLYAGLFLLVAVAGVGLAVFRRRPRSLHVVAMIGAVLALVGALGVLFSEQRSVGVPIGDLLGSDTGRPLLWLLIAVLAADALAVLGSAKDAWRPLLWGSGAAAAAAMWVRARGGHAAAADPPLPQELAQWAHMVAAGLWIGGLVLLWLVLREARRDDGEPRLADATRFSNVAVVAVAVVAVTGLVRSFEELERVDAVGNLLDTSYGQVLGLKVVLALGLIGLGAVNRRRSIPRLAEDAGALRRIVGAELVVALGVVALTAALTGSAPPDPEGGTPAAPPAVVTAEGTDFATTTSVALTLAPGAPGPSTLEVVATDPDDGDALPADDVALRVRSVTRPDVAPESVPLVRQGDAWTATTSVFSLAGTYATTAVVRTGADAVEVPLVVTTRLPDANQTVDVGPGIPTVTTTTFADGSSIQTYVDPGTAGANQVHATAFTQGGNERGLDDLVIVAIADDSEPRRLQVTPFGPGHLVANVDLQAGDWTFDVVATSDGSTLQATFDETIGAT